MLPTLDAQEPAWSKWFVFLITLLTCVYVACGVNTHSTRTFVGVSLVSAAGFLALEFWLIVGLDLWLKLAFPTALLGSGLALQSIRRMVFRRSHYAQGVSSKAPENADRMMGLALQGQGQLDMAFEHFQHTPMNETAAGDLYWLAIEYERQLRFDKAKEIYEYITRYISDFKDVKARLSGANATADRPQNSEPTAKPLDASINDTALGQPKSLGRYRIEKPLGKGAMGVVYLGKDAKIGRPVALKTMALGQEFDGAELIDARDRFFREAKAAGRLQHPGIVTIFDVGEEGDLAFIAMEYVAGQDLQAFCKKNQLMPVPRVVSIVRRVAQALAYAHRHQVIHRDIKPSNVMYDLITDTVKVTDFGVARITDGNKTRTGVVLGSPSYMATEQLAGLTLDGRSDLYALGVMLFQLLTGVLPFRATSLAELMSKIANDPAPDIRQFRSELPEGLAHIVARLLEKLPENRYQDGQALDHALSSYAEHVQSRMASPTTSAPPQGAPDATNILDLEL
jgi:serine/threonine-protein kinase